ncbi:hypothetical protein D3C86_2237440 [compost metagenome]
MSNNPLTEAAAILLCLLAVVAGGHYYQKYHEKEVLQVPVRQDVKPNLDLSKFEVSVKVTE